MGKFSQFLAALSDRDRSVFSFPNDNFSMYERIFTKLGVCIDIVEICCGIADGQICQLFTVICAGHYGIFISGQ